MRRPPPRPGFSLLEMVLAVSLSTVLLSAVYWLYSTQISSAQAGRAKLAEITLARALLARMAGDIVSQVGPHDPRLAADSSATSSPFNLGVYGEASRLVLSVGRIPRVPATKAAANPAPTELTDLRRITYWTVGPAGDAQGLARHELTGVTGDEAALLPPEGVDPSACLIASEVASLTFEYFDGGDWQTSWDGTLPGPDGETPLGPPAAIRITLELRRPGLTTTTEEERPRFQHVVALPTANSFTESSLP